MLFKSEKEIERNASSSILVRYMKRRLWSFQILKELVLGRGPEHKRLRNKKVDEEKFVLDLSTIALISGELYTYQHRLSRNNNLIKKTETLPADEK